MHLVRARSPRRGAGCFLHATPLGPKDSYMRAVRTTKRGAGGRAGRRAGGRADRLTGRRAGGLTGRQVGGRMPGLAAIGPSDAGFAGCGVMLCVGQTSAMLAAPCMHGRQPRATPGSVASHVPCIGQPPTHPPTQPTTQPPTHPPTQTHTHTNTQFTHALTAAISRRYACIVSAQRGGLFQLLCSCQGPFWRLSLGPRGAAHMYMTARYKGNPP